MKKPCLLCFAIVMTCLTVTGCAEPSGQGTVTQADNKPVAPASSRARWFSTPVSKKPAPDFELTALDGGKVRLSEYRGKPVVLQFFAFGCAPCRAEAPHISYLAEQHRSDGLVVLAVNAWDEPKEILQQYIEQNNFRQRVLLNGAEVFERYDIPRGTVPTVFWIDRGGMIVDTIVGGTNPSNLRRNTTDLINSKS